MGWTLGDGVWVIASKNERMHLTNRQIHALITVLTSQSR